MDLTKRFVLSTCAVLLMVSAGVAGSYPVPTVEYSGDMKMESTGMLMETRMFMAKDKQRMETHYEKMGMDAITITRLDKNVAWSLMPSSKTYTEMNLNDSMKQSGDFRTCTYDASGGSSDTVNGISAKKSHAKVVCPEVEYEGDFWTTSEGITVKMDLQGKAKDGSVFNFKAEMRNLKIGRQDPSVFEIPAGYTSMGNVNDMARDFQRQMEEAKKQQAEAERQQAIEEKKRAEEEARRERERAEREKEAAGRDYTAQSRKSQESAPGNAKGGASSGGSGMPTVEDAVKGGLKSIFKW